MPLSSSQPKRAHPPPRRTVRIVKRRTSRPANISLAVAAAAAVVLLAVWRLWQTEEVIVPQQRQFRDIDVVWKCEVGHSFKAAGQIGSKACWTCDRPAFPVTYYACRIHGPYEIAARFAAGEGGVARISELRRPGLEWVSIEEGVNCPRCKRRLVHKTRDPAENASRADTGGR